MRITSARSYSPLMILMHTPQRSNLVLRGNERPGEVLGVGAEDARVGTVIRLGKS